MYKVGKNVAIRIQMHVNRWWLIELKCICQIESAITWHRLPLLIGLGTHQFCLSQNNYCPVKGIHLLFHNKLYHKLCTVLHRECLEENLCKSCRNSFSRFLYGIGVHFLLIYRPKSWLERWESYFPTRFRAETRPFKVKFHKRFNHINADLSLVLNYSISWS